LYEKNFSESDLTADVFSARRMPDRIHYRIVKCKEDGLIRSSPVVDEKTLSELYGDSKFTYIGETENLIETYLGAIGPVLRTLPRDANILEVGCGNGFLLERLYLMGYKNVYGVEPSRDAVGQASESVRDNIVVDILRHGIFGQKKFQFIFFFQTLDHDRDPNGFLDACYAMLTSDGTVVAFNHDVDSFSARILKEKSPIIDIAHTYLYSRDTIKRIFVQHNFRPVKIYSPANTISVRYLLWLLPVSNKIKTGILDSRSRLVALLLRIKLKLRLGNLCIVAKKT
jgi:SAM-dependent methyltransferase